MGEQVVASLKLSKILADEGELRFYYTDELSKVVSGL